MCISILHEFIMIYHELQRGTRIKPVIVRDIGKIVPHQIIFPNIEAHYISCKPFLFC